MTTGERILVLERQARATGWRMFSLVIVLLLTGFGVWAATAHLDEVAVAPGEVKPQGRVKTIQHLEGGIVRAISVREGQEVAEGDELLQIRVNLLQFAVQLPDEQFISRGIDLNERRAFSDVPATFDRVAFESHRAGHFSG